jgi:hypothetical protein
MTVQADNALLARILRELATDKPEAQDEPADREAQDRAAHALIKQIEAR